MCVSCVSHVCLMCVSWISGVCLTINRLDRIHAKEVGLDTSLSDLWFWKCCFHVGRFFFVRKHSYLLCKHIFKTFGTRLATRSIDHTFDPSIARSLTRSRDPDRSLARTFDRSIECSINRSLDRSQVSLARPKSHPKQASRTPTQTITKTIPKNLPPNPPSKLLWKLKIKKRMHSAREWHHFWPTPPPPLGPPTNLRKPELATVWTWVCALGFELEISNGWAPRLILREIEWVIGRAIERATRPSDQANKWSNMWLSKGPSKGPSQWSSDHTEGNQIVSMKNLFLMDVNCNGLFGMIYLFVFAMFF